MTPKCIDCDDDVRPGAPGVWVEVTGFAPNRTGGGTNAIRDRTPTGRFVCRQCGALRDAGAARNQGAMFG